MLPILLQSEKKTDIEIEQSHNNSVHPDNTESVEYKCSTLLDWISSTDSKSTTDQLFEHCSKVLEQVIFNMFKILNETDLFLFLP